MHFRPFEIVLIGIFVLFAVGGLIFLSMVKGGGDNNGNTYGESVVIWGTFDHNVVDETLSAITATDKAFAVVTYREIDERSFESELLNALAEGNPPDLVLLPHSLLVSYRSKLTAIPPASLDVRTFRDTYIDGAEIFSLADGIYAVPLAVDPLVLFWNRDLFSNAGLAQPPKTWEELVSKSVPALTVLDAHREVLQSAIGMGEYQNVNHAKEILSMLLFQAGGTVVEEKNDQYVIMLSQTYNRGVPPAQAAFDFYTRFGSPGSDVYTWNRSQQFDRNAFTAGKLGMYLGFGSEIKDIEDENPNLNFDVAPVPQSEGATALRDYGTFYGFAIPKSSKNASGAYRVAQLLTSPAIAKDLVSGLGLTPVNRSLYAGVSSDRYGDVLKQVALLARGWLDPNPEESKKLFKEMIENINSGRFDVEQAINDASYTLEKLFR